jgi:hypothetical protein
MFLEKATMLPNVAFSSFIIIIKKNKKIKVLSPLMPLHAI